MTPLKELIAHRIRNYGPMTIDEFMSICMLDPDHGYYSGRDPLGVAGDFTTSPEISQMFGELVGLCIAQTWIDQGRPARFALAELGPGRGTLMSDILRATRNIPGFCDAAKVYLVEQSRSFKDIQRANLPGFGVGWIETARQLPNLPLFLVANEFFDALPVNQYRRHAKGWEDIQLGLAGMELAFLRSAFRPSDFLDERYPSAETGDIVEVRVGAEEIMKEISGKVSKHGGVAIIIDYGDSQISGDTLRAIKEHEAVDPLAEPGLADLSAHVDFGALARAATGVSVTPPVPQGVFLERLGISARARKLADKLNSNELEEHVAAHRRLTAPDEMGELFKAMAVYPADASPPPGFIE